MDVLPGEELSSQEAMLLTYLLCLFQESDNSQAVPLFHKKILFPKN